MQKLVDLTAPRAFGLRGRRRRPVQPVPEIGHGALAFRQRMAGRGLPERVLEEGPGTDDQRIGAGPENQGLSLGSRMISSGMKRGRPESASWTETLLWSGPWEETLPLS
jgi:hypothetical protein